MLLGMAGIPVIGAGTSVNDLSWATAGRLTYFTICTTNTGFPIEVVQNGWSKALSDTDVFVDDGEYIVQVFWKIITAGDKATGVLFKNLGGRGFISIGRQWITSTTVSVHSTIKNDTGTTITSPAFNTGSNSGFDFIVFDTVSSNLSVTTAGWVGAAALAGLDVSMGSSAIGGGSHPDGTSVAASGFASGSTQCGILLAVQI